MGPYTIKDILGGFSFCAFLLRNIETEDTPEDVLEDLREADILNAENESKHQALVKSLFDTYKVKFRDEQLRKDYSFKVLKYLMASDWVIDVRAINKKTFSYEKDNINTYKPEIQNFVPLVIITLKIDSDEYVRFQVDEETLRHFRDDVEAMLKDLEVVKKLILKS